LSPVRTKHTPAEMERRALAALESAGGALMRDRLRLATNSALRAVQFDRFVGDLVARGLVGRERSMRRFTAFGGKPFERPCTVYRLVTREQEQRP
jgi:hypothetical protein